jgi:hypothetical protein
MPSFTSSSAVICSSPHVRFAEAIFTIRHCKSAGSGGRPRGRDLQRQNNRKPWRCHLRSVPAAQQWSGFDANSELWKRKTEELQFELENVRLQMARQDKAGREYERTGLRMLELTQTAYSQYLMETPAEQARVVRMLHSNCTFDRGSLYPTYTKPFDLFARGSETGDWLLRLDSNQQPSG